jgi:nicotinate phosphoribosyltransferase
MKRRRAGTLGTIPARPLHQEPTRGYVMIIANLLDVDFYKFTMSQAYYHQYPGAVGTYRFKCRTPDIDFTPIIPRILDEMRDIEALTIRREHTDYLRNTGLFKEDYLDWLSTMKLLRKDWQLDSIDGTMHIIVRGPLHRVTFWETMVLAIVNECYFDFKGACNYDGAMEWLSKKMCEAIEAKPKLNFFDFGTRRRRSWAWQGDVLHKLNCRKDDFDCGFRGTSNVSFARTLDLPVVGTMAHEWICCAQGFVHPRDSQRHALQLWHKEYGGALGIALSDTLGLDAFLRDFDKPLAATYDGVRQDSGDPFGAGRKIINHYHKLGIWPIRKKLIFSDGLNFDTISALSKEFAEQINVSFGIGTNLMNDGFGEPLQIVMKLTDVNGRPVAKLSDTPGKEMCEDGAYVAYLRKAFEI